MASKLYALKGEKFDISKVTVIGSPTITSDGVVLSTSANNYFYATDFNSALPNKLTINFKVRTPTTLPVSHTWTALCLRNSEDSNARFYCRIDNNTSNWYFGYKKSDNTYQNKRFTEILANTLYDITINIDGSNITFKVNGEEFLNGDNLKIDTNVRQLCVGTNFNTDQYWENFDLKTVDYSVDNQLVYTPTKPTYLLERRKEGYDPSKFTVVGSPTITNDGIASGFGVGNDTERIEIPFDYLDKDFILKGEFTLGASNSATYIIGGWRSSGFLDVYKMGSTNSFTSHLFLDVDGTRTSFTIANNNDGSYFILPYNIQANESCLWYLKRTGSTYEFGMKKSNATEHTTAQVVSEYNLVAPTNNRQVVATAQSADTLKSVDLKQYSIIVDGKEVFTGAKEQFYAFKGGK